MQKYFLAIFLFAVFSGCEKDFDEVIDVAVISYQVTGTNSYPSNTFRYVAGDSLITIYINFNSTENITSVFCDMIASDGTKLNDNPILLLDNGNSANGDERAEDFRFTNKFPLSRQNPIGTYKINYYVTDTENITKFAVVQQFIYDNGQNNIAPVISNLVLADTVSKGVSFIFSVTTNDLNGLNDIEVVYFELTRPDGTKVEENPGDTIFSMHDDGNFEVFGDITAGDGVYSFKNSFSSSSQVGSWKFEFHARDRGNLLSNSIEKFLIVK